MGAQFQFGAVEEFQFYKMKSLEVNSVVVQQCEYI